MSNPIYIRLGGLNYGFYISVLSLLSNCIPDNKYILSICICFSTIFNNINNLLYSKLHYC